MPASQADFDRLVQAARQLLTESKIIGQVGWAVRAGVSDATARELYDDAGRRAALERAVGARWSHADGGYFLIR